LPLTWHVADAEVVKIFRKLFETNKWTHIKVVHSRPAP